MNEPTSLINNTTAVLMITLALFYDLVQFLTEGFFGLLAGTAILAPLATIGPVVAFLITVWAWLSFYVWFKMKGVSFGSAKRASAMVGGALIEMLPVINMLPAWTLSVATIIITTRAEEKIQKIPGAKAVTNKLPTKK